jgi:hypothetical protein
VRSVPKTPRASSSMPDIVARVTYCETCCQRTQIPKGNLPPGEDGCATVQEGGRTPQNGGNERLVCCPHVLEKQRSALHRTG